MNLKKSTNILSIRTSLPKEIKSRGTKDWWDKTWTSGFFKTEITKKTWLGHLGLDGDGQADKKVHGGIDKAVCVYPNEHYQYWNSLFDINQSILGSFGENFTTESLLEKDVCIGDIFEVGEAIVQVSQPRQPCWKLSRRWKIKNFSHTVQIEGKTGYYFRVLQSGIIEPTSILTLKQRINKLWNISLCNEIMHIDKKNMKMAKELSLCKELSESWKDSLTKRVQKGYAEPTDQRLKSLE